jgi:thioredoxin 1
MGLADTRRQARVSEMTWKEIVRMSANVISTDDRGFERTVLQSPEPVLVDFWAPWCGPCRRISPIVEELAGEYAGRLRAVKVNVDESPDVAGRYGIMSIPALVFFKDGREVGRVIGAVPKARLAGAVEQVLGATETSR